MSIASVFKCLQTMPINYFRYCSNLNLQIILLNYYQCREHIDSIKAMTHQPTQLLSLVWLGPVDVCVIGLQLDFFFHSSLIPDCLVGSGPPYDSTVELGWVMCHGL